MIATSQRIARSSGWSKWARRRRTIIAVVTYAALVVGGLAAAYPLITAVVMSLLGQGGYFWVAGIPVPRVPHFENYIYAFTYQPLMARWLLNSVVIVVLAVPGAAVTAILAGYAFARFEFPGRDFWFLVTLCVALLPGEVTMVPSYILFHKLGWLNTYLPLIVPPALLAGGQSFAGGGLDVQVLGALSIFLVRQFFMTLPRELDDAARMDGANSWSILWRVLVPLSAPVIVTIVFLQALGRWNDYVGPWVYLSARPMYTLALALGAHLVAVYQTMVIMAIPMIALFFYGQRYFVRGIVMSGLKM